MEDCNSYQQQKMTQVSPQGQVQGEAKEAIALFKKSNIGLKEYGS